MADTPQAVDSLERIRKALETQALTHPGVAICDKSDLRSLLAREAALRARLDVLDNLPAEDFIRKVARQMGPPPFDTWPVSHVCQQNAEEAAELVAAYDEIARAALASTEPTKD